jgi:hypothetical protein
MRIEDITACPHCGSTFGYYRKVRYKGSYNDTALFEDRQPYNSAMWDGAVETYISKYYFCVDCHKKICKAVDYNHYK